MKKNSLEEKSIRTDNGTEENKKYPFEKKSFRKIEDTGKNIEILNERLGLKRLDLENSNIKHKIHSLVSVYNGNIEWYIKKINLEKFYQILYLIFTAILIVFIPIALVYFTDLVAEKTEIGNDGFAFYSSLSVAILTSLIGLHKVMNSWLGKRKLLSIFHQAAAELKSKFYSFEDMWNDRSSEIFKSEGSEAVSEESEVVSEEFDKAVELLITEGRAIANTERKQYFEHIENPEVDLSNILSTSFTQAAGLLKNFQSTRFTKKLEEIEAQVKAEGEKKKLKTEIAAFEKQLELYQEWLKEVKELLKNIPDNTDLKARKKKIEQEIDTTKEELIKKKVQLT